MVPAKAPGMREREGEGRGSGEAVVTRSHGHGVTGRQTPRDRLGIGARLEVL